MARRPRALRAGPRRIAHRSCRVGARAAIDADGGILLDDRYSLGNRAARQRGLARALRRTLKKLARRESHLRCADPSGCGATARAVEQLQLAIADRKSTRLNSSH